MLDSLNVPGAAMLIIRMTTSGTPVTTPDETMVMVSSYASMADCQKDLANAPLSEGEQGIELKLRLRVIRSCTPIRGESIYRYWYNWGIGRSESGESFLETGPFRGR